MCQFLGHPVDRVLLHPIVVTHKHTNTHTHTHTRTHTLILTGCQCTRCRGRREVSWAVSVLTRRLFFFRLRCCRQFTYRGGRTMHTHYEVSQLYWRPGKTISVTTATQLQSELLSIVLRSDRSGFYHATCCRYAYRTLGVVAWRSGSVVGLDQRN